MLLLVGGVLFTIAGFGGVQLAFAEFHERVDFYTIPKGLTAAHFQFKQTLEWEGELELNHFDFGTFPRPIVELVKYNKVFELRTSLSKGRWDHKVWGVPPITSTSWGIEVEGIIPKSSDDTQELILNNWARLVATLAGLFCGSINLIDAQCTSIPQLSNAFKSQQNFGIHSNASVVKLYGKLPGEAVCAENLTPWSKLSPCSGFAGISMLINPLKIFDSTFHQFGINVQLLCLDQDCKRKQIYMIQDLLTVFDLSRHQKSLDWCIEEIFGRKVTRSCPAAQSSIMNFIKPESCPSFKVKEKDAQVYMETLTLADNQIIDRNIQVDGISEACTSLKPSPLIVSRLLSGIGQESGGLVITWKNLLPDKDLEIVHLESLPYYMRLFTSQMSFSNAERQLLQDFPKKIIYAPSVARKYPLQLEFLLVIPAGQEVTLEIPFEKEFLRYTDYPFDPNRGFDLSGATIEFIDPTTKIPHCIVTPKLLLTMPTPDFTMIYNVITLTSTLIVLFYGTFFNLSYRRFYTGVTAIGRLAIRIRGALRRLLGFLKRSE